MQDQIAKVVEDIQNMMKRFPEFEAVSLGMEIVRYPTKEGGFISTREPVLAGREREGDWLSGEALPELLVMNDMLDWSAETRALLDRIGLRSRAIVFSRDADQSEQFMQQIAERAGQQSTSTSPGGM